MLLTNHALTGVALGLSIDNEVLLAPTAFASHFALDSMPHFGLPNLDFRSLKGFTIGSIDFACAGAVTLAALWLFPARRGHIAVGVLGATLPDLFYLPEIFIKIRVFPKLKAFHGRIQWSESLPGIAVDGLWATLMINLIFRLK